MFAALPDRIERTDAVVLERTTIDDLPHIQQVWPLFERLVGLRGRKFYARADERVHTHTVCTPLREDDNPDRLGLVVGTLPGGWYLRDRIRGGAAQVYRDIAPGIAELKALLPMDAGRPLIEHYRGHDELELWLPIHGADHER